MYPPFVNTWRLCVLFLPVSDGFGAESDGLSLFETLYLDPYFIHDNPIQVIEIMSARDKFC